MSVASFAKNEKKNFNDVIPNISVLKIISLSLDYQSYIFLCLWGTLPETDNRKRLNASSANPTVILCRSFIPVIWLMCRHIRFIHLGPSLPWKYCNYMLPPPPPQTTVNMVMVNQIGWTSLIRDWAYQNWKLSLRDVAIREGVNA